MRRRTWNGHRIGKCACSMVLAFAMTITAVSLPGCVGKAAETDTKEEYAAGTNMSPTDLVQIKLGDSIYPMETYYNGVYEYAKELDAGTYTAKILVNGEEKYTTKEVKLAEKGTVYFRADDKEVKDSVNDALIHTAAFTGDFTGVNFEKAIANWDPADANAELHYVGGGLYRGTFSFAALDADTAIEYKVAFDDGWDYNVGATGYNGDNVKVTLPKGSTSFTVVCDEPNGKLYDDVTSKFDKDISLIGDVRGTENTWTTDTTGYEFHMVTPSVYVYTMSLKAGTYGYKCVFDHTDHWYEGDNINLTLTEDAFVTFVYDTASEKLYDSVNDNEATAKFLGMTPTPVGGKVISNANGSVTFQMAADAGKKVVLFYAEKTETPEFKSTELTETKAGLYVSDAVSFGDAAADIVYYYTVDGAETLDSSQGTVKVGDKEYSNFKKEAYTGRDLYVPGTFPGPSWDAASNQMTYQGNGLYAYTFQNVPAANYEYKIAAAGSWAENYGAEGKQDGSNYSLSVPETQDVTVYYNDESHLSVTSLNYVFSDVILEGAGERTSLEDSGLTGIYSKKISLPAGTYAAAKLTVDTAGQKTEYAFEPFTLEKEKDVTFYFAPSYGIYYHDADSWSAEEAKIVYDSKSTAYKSLYGAVPTATDVKFTIATGEDITKVSLIFKKNSAENKAMEKDGAAKDGIQKWSVTVSFDEIGEYQYFFAVYHKTSVRFYSDDDGYYGKGKLGSLTDVKPYDLVVYKKGFQTPDWMKNAVIYQIFPDRFYNGDSSNDQAQTSARGATDYEFVDWNYLPENPEQEGLLSKADYEATGAYYGDGEWNNDMYGGDLKGITEKIDYLKALGVNVIYLNPVFASISSHRYDTSDYSKIDPILGTMGDFTELSEAAKKNGMHIVLDGVFNHVSDDSVYFDRYYKFLKAGTNKIGAYPYWAYVYDYMAEKQCEQAEAEKAAKEYFTNTYGITDFSYTEWFEIFNASMKDGDGNETKDTIGERAGKPVYNYDGWWGYDNMPVIKATNGSEFQSGTWGKEIIEGSDSIGQYWISHGSDGWRLDVANEVSDETWQHFRDSVKSLNNGDAVIIGEIWDDATEYLLGDMYDSVMNYVFRSAVTGFAKGDSAQTAMNTLEKIRERYPEEAFYAMMNLVGSHDTTRLLSYLDGIDDDRNQKEVENAFPTYEKTSEQAKKRQYLVAFLQFAYAGAPTIYYGDEIGMVGADDPDDRRAFTWGEGNEELVTWYAKLAGIRSQYEALRTGSVEPVETGDENIVSFIRRDAKDVILVLANNAEQDKEVTLNIDGLAVSGDNFADAFVDSLDDVVNGRKASIKDGKLTVSVPAYSGVLLTTNPKEVTVDKEHLKPAYEGGSEGKLTNTIKGVKKTYTKAYGSKAFTLKPSAKGTITYSSSNKKVVTVSKKGKVTIKGTGKAKITIKAAGNDTYQSGKLVVTITVKPAKVTGLKAKAQKKQMKVTWKKAKGSVTGYQISYATGNKFKGAKQKLVKGASKISAAVKKLTGGKKYFVRVRAYKTVSVKKIYGAWSVVKSATVKK